MWMGREVREMENKKIARLGFLTAVGLMASYIELLVPIPIGIPGVKLGLANMVVVWALYMLGPLEALLVNGMRIMLSGFLFGNLSMILFSLAGALVSFGGMWGVKKSGKFGVVGVSVVGGVMHNVGQLLVAVGVLETSGILYYYGPVLLVAGVITGMVIGVVTVEVLKRVR